MTEPQLIASSAKRHPELVSLLRKIEEKHAVVGIAGLGYVGLPLALTFQGTGFKVLGFDINPARTQAVNRGDDLINYLEPASIRRAVESGRLSATSNMLRFGEADVIIICVPTPLTRHQEPDLSFIKQTASAIAQSLRPGQLVVLESTTWPGTTKEVVKPILEAQSGLSCGLDFFLAFSPEREDPGNAQHSTKTIPKVVGADDPASMQAACLLYRAAISHVVPVDSSAAAEAVKLTENIFRSVNIALVNELKQIYGALGIDIWSVIDAASTKPFGYMPFYPGPGLGGHCIPIDPFYLTWKAREHGIETRFIELAGLVNTRMPKLIVDRLVQILQAKGYAELDQCRILMIGAAYKKNINDVRESPALEIMDLISERGGSADYHDPYIPVMPQSREYAGLAGLKSVDLTGDVLRSYDAIVLTTDHDCLNYSEIAETARVIVDTRNAFGRRGHSGSSIFKA